MSKKRKNEALTDIELYQYLSSIKSYSKKWTTKKSSNQYIQEILNGASKRNTGKRGEPDLIYINEARRLLILIENKHSINDHQSENEHKPTKYAVDGITHYLSFFTPKNLSKHSLTIRNYFENWSVVGIAFSGDIHDEYNHLISTFIITNEGNIKDIETSEILDEEDYIAFFENIDVESISKNIAKSSSEINRLLRTLNSQDRPVLLSALMICLYDKNNFSNDFKKSYSQWSIANIIRNIPTTISDILLNEGIDISKINILINELSFVKTDHDLNNSDILKVILKELEENVIPLFNKRTNYDIIGKFYEEFLRYAGVANVKKGIVLTPSHITQLFTELIDIKTNDVILDTCCGTGTFLIAGMNKLLTIIEQSNLSNKKQKITEIKQNQLIGLEKSTTMYSLAISNMLFRGDGKSRIFNVDAFSENAEKILKNLSNEGITPSIGFINPPYGGRANKSNPTKKEIQFLEYLLDRVSRFGIIIAPLSTYFKDNIIRNRILSKHTLKYVVNMPKDLFQPNAATHTAIAVFETNIPHNDKTVVFYNLLEDGFVLSKNRGRSDVLNKWNTIKKAFLSKLKNPQLEQDSIHLVTTPIKANDEWIIQAHSKTDYSHISEKIFIQTLKKHLIFTLKKKFNLLDKDIDVITLMEILNDSINPKALLHQNKKLALNKWKEFYFNEIFDFKRGSRLVKLNQIEGDIAYISSTKENNGIDNYILPPEDMTVYQNVLTINNSGSVGYVFYHNYKIVCSDHCTIISVKKDFLTDLNKYIALFLIPLIEAMKPKYNFAREISDARLNKEKILLPIKQKNQPDWAYMENYIKSLPYSASL